jgi:putative sigma-54 modulation protein
MYAAIDLVVDKLDRQVVRHKDRVQGHQHEALKHQPQVQIELPPQ